MTGSKEQHQLEELAAQFSRDALGFVLAAFPWSEAGTQLANQDGPDTWQADILTAIGNGLLTPGQAIQIAIASGHGPGKSALVAWIILWAMATMPDTRGVVTANTENQLRTKTWSELAKWHRLCLWAEWFDLTATAIFARDPAHEKTWRIDAVAWSERNVEAFAGLHNAGARVLVIMDEASAIPDVIWETTEGALTDTETQIIWLAAGNPTRNVGRFRECWGRFRHRWITRQVDSRTAKLTNKAQIAKWIADYGDDSDFVRVRVRGVFPRAGSQQFIGGDLVEAAQQREAVAHAREPLILGVDVARFGDDQTVIATRRGRDARTWGWKKYRELDTMQVAARVAEQIEALKPNAVFIDGGGVGGGVVDRLLQLGYSVIEVNFGGKADGTVGDFAPANKRSEMWARLRAWLPRGAIPADDPELAADLVAPEYDYDAQQRLLLEGKPEMKRRGLASPDAGDALALTFAYPVAEGQSALPVGSVMQGRQVTAIRAYDPFERAGL